MHVLWAPIIMGGVAEALAVACGVAASAAKFKAKRIEELPTIAVREVRPGLVEVKGQVSAAGALLESPMSARSCVYYRFTVEERRRQGKSTKWVTVIDDVQCAPVQVRDASGTISVDLAKAELHLETDARARSGFLNDAPEALEQALQERYRRSSTGALFNKAMRYTETVLAPGDPLFVIGTASHDGREMRIGRSDEKNAVFLVTDKGEGALTSSLHRTKWLNGVGAAVFGAAGLGLMVVGVLPRL